MSEIIPTFSEEESFHKDFYKDFNISSYEDDPQEDLNRARPHRHTYFEIIWIKEGHGTHLIDFKEYEFDGPCLFILNTGIVHKINKKVPTKGYVVKFSESFLAEDMESGNVILKYGLFDNITPRPVFHLDSSAVDLLNDLMHKMLEEYHHRSELSRTILLSYLKVFLLQVHKQRELTNRKIEYNSPRHQIFIQLKKLIENHYKEHKSVSFYAEQLNTSKRNLNDIVNALVGKSISTLIKERILLESKRLLFAGSDNVKEISYELGFDDPAYFTRFFSKNTGLAPSEFRGPEVHN